VPNGSLAGDQETKPPNVSAPYASFQRDDSSRLTRHFCSDLTDLTFAIDYVKCGSAPAAF